MISFAHSQVRRGASCLAAALMLAFSASAALAATSTWTGGGAPSVNWSLAANWGGTAPTSATTTDLIFAGTTNTGTAGTPLNQNIANPFVLNSIAFSSSTSSFFLGGNPLRFNGAGDTITQNSSSAESIANNIDATGKTGNNTETITLTGNGTGVVTLSGNILAGNGLRDYAITKTGTGTFVLSGTNTYGGATTVSAGILNIQNNTALGATGSGTSVTSGATLQIQNSITVGAEALTLNGTGATGQNGALVNVSGTNNYGGLVTLGSATTISSDGGTLNLTNTGTITGATFGLTLTGSGNGSVSSVIGTTSGSLTKSGSGSWTLIGASTYTGATSVNAGTLKLGVANALSATSGVTVNNTGSLRLGANDTINNAATMTLNGNVTTNNPSTKNLVVTNSEGSSTTSSATAGLGSLTLQSRSTLDFLQSTSTIVFGQTGGTAFVDASSFKLDIYNYLGDSTPTGNLDHLVFQQDMSGLTGDFEFWDGSVFVAATATQLGSSGFWEITPLTPIPEPTTWLSATLALGTIVWTQRKRVRLRASSAIKKHF